MGNLAKDNLTLQSPNNTPRLIDQIRALADLNGLSEVTKISHISWILRYIRFHNKRHPKDLNKHHVEQFLSHLGLDLNYDQSIQSRALNALLFLYGDLLDTPLGNLSFTKNKTRRGFISRFGHSHCQSVINKMSGSSQLMTKLAVAANLKLREIINLRLSDIDFKKNNILIRETNGDLKFVANIPLQLILELRIQTIKVHRLLQLHKQQVLGENHSEMTILANQLEPEWQYLFPSNCEFEGKQQSPALNRTSLSLLKNDLKIAIHNYLMFLPIQQSPKKQVRIKKWSKPQFNRREQELAFNGHRNNQDNPQTSFNFTNQLNVA